MSLRAVWQRRPATAVTRLNKRELLVLSARDLLRGARAAERLLVAFVAPSYPAMCGFARAAREIGAPLLFARPSGADEQGPSESRDDAWFVEAAFRAAAELRFEQPMALLKDPPRAGSSLPDAERVRGELETGFTGVAVSARAGEPVTARDAALAAAEACRLDLGVELVPLGGSAAQALEMARGAGGARLPLLRAAPLRSLRRDAGRRRSDRRNARGPRARRRAPGAARALLHHRQRDRAARAGLARHHPAHRVRPLPPRAAPGRPARALGRAAALGRRAPRLARAVLRAPPAPPARAARRSAGDAGGALLLRGRRALRPGARAGER